MSVMNSRILYDLSQLSVLKRPILLTCQSITDSVEDHFAQETELPSESPMRNVRIHAGQDLCFSLEIRRSNLNSNQYEP